MGTSPVNKSRSAAPIKQEEGEADWLKPPMRKSNLKGPKDQKFHVYLPEYTGAQWMRLNGRPYPTMVLRHERLNGLKPDAVEVTIPLGVRWGLEYSVAPFLLNI